MSIFFKVISEIVPGIKHDSLRKGGGGGGCSNAPCFLNVSTRQMFVSFIFTAALLPVKELMVSNGEEAGWAPLI